MTQHRKAQASALIGLFLLAAACGQKPGVFDQGIPAGAAAQPGVNPTTGEVIDPVTGEVIDPGTGGSTGTGTVSGGDTTTGGSTTTGNGSTTTGGGDTGGGDGEPAPGEPTGGDTTGVTDSVIRIGFHAPITGAAPVPAQAFESGKDRYWEFLKSENQSINGRDVEVVFRNDNYNPSQAVAGCKEMVEQDKVFLLVGFAGVDQIQACARYAASVGVPYISAGVSENSVNTLPNYLTMWMSYADQTPLLADYLITKNGAADEINGMVRFNTPGFQDAHDGFIAAMTDQGAEVQYDRAVSKTAGQTDAQTIATELNQQGVDNVFVLTSPTWFIQLLQAAQSQGYHPLWTGIGLSHGIDTVPNVACKNQNSIDGARLLNPFPAVIDSNKFDQNYTKARGPQDTSNGSIEWGLWGANRVIAEFLLLPGENLTRERLIYFGERVQGLKTGVYPDITLTPDYHFATGGGMHLIRADCSQNRWVTEQSFVTDF